MIYIHLSEYREPTETAQRGSRQCHLQGKANSLPMMFWYLVSSVTEVGVTIGGACFWRNIDINCQYIVLFNKILTLILGIVISKNMYKNFFENTDKDIGKESPLFISMTSER